DGREIQRFSNPAAAELRYPGFIERRSGLVFPGCQAGKGGHAPGRVKSSKLEFAEQQRDGLFSDAGNGPEQIALLFQVRIVVDVLFDKLRYLLDLFLDA